MPWRDSSPMDLKTQFIADYLRQTLTITELCYHYNISRKTGYKWIDRYLEEGATGLADRSRRPHHCPHQTPGDQVASILGARGHHPTWGAKKLLKLLARRQLKCEWPARTTVCNILSRHNLIQKPRRRRLIGHPGKPTSIITAPNQIWSADFKGHFKTRDGHYCYPLTVADSFSRYLLGCQALHSTSCTDAKPIFRRLFQEFGMPDRIRTDNGVPFATVSLARLSTLSAWFVRLGIMPELIEPGKPQQNGRHERMHRTLKAEATRPPAANCCTQQRTFNRFREEFNNDRPHEAIALETPASVYQPSPRPYPARLPPLEYPAHFEKRYVSYNGGIRWKSAWVHASLTCAGEYLGLEAIDNGLWNVYFGPLRLGRLSEQHMRIEDEYGSLWRHKKKQKL
jgi:putative transposase